jgi:polyisoprenoid-binding protein YceI
MGVKPLFFFPLFFFCITTHAQKYTLEKSSVQFYSDATIEDIKANNFRTSSIFNIANGEVAFSIPIKEFEFDKDLMKEHFNEKYMESHHYPKSTFTGKFQGVKQDITEEQSVLAVGKLTIHGVTKEVSIPGTLELRGNQIVARSKFVIHLADYKVEIPKLLWQNIAEDVEVSVEFIYKKI